MIDRSVRLAVTGLLGAGLALTAAVWPSGGATPTGAGAVAAETAPDGASLFRTKGCASCHTTADASARFPVGPSLATLAGRAGTASEGLDAEAYVRQSIRDPQAVQVPGFATVRMPTLAISDAELDALVRYLLG